MIWIWLSDCVLIACGISGELNFWAEVLKGTAFVTLTAAVVYLAAGREARVHSNSTRLLEAVIAGTTDAVFVKDSAGRYLLFNEGAARLVGRPAEDVVGNDDTFLFDPEGARRVMSRDRRVMATGQPETEEEELTADGVTRTYLATKAPLRDERGAVVGVVGMSRDITDRKQIEDALRESEERYRALAEADGAILNALSSHVALLDATRKVSAVNESWRGYAVANRLDPERTLGTNYAQVARSAVGRNSAEGSVVADGVDGVLQGRLAQYRLRYPCHSPTEEQWFEVIVNPFREGGGAVVMHVNVTETARAEAAVRESEERFRRGEALLSAVLDTLPVSVIIADPTGRPVRMNPATHTILGRAPHSQNVDAHAECVGFWPDSGRRVEPHEWPMSRALLGGETSTGVRVRIAGSATGRNDTWNCPPHP